MKRLIILLLPFSIFLTSCSSNLTKDVYFIHAIGFDAKDGGQTEISAIVEKLDESSKDNPKYFTISQKGRSLEKITDKIKKNYKECYFATAEVFFFGDDISKSDITELSPQIIGDADFPNKSNAISISGYSCKDFFKQIKSDDDMKRIIKLTGESGSNITAFLSKICENKNCRIPSLTLDGDGKIIKAQAKHFDGRKAANE